MPSYIITYTGYVKEPRPQNYPKEVTDFIIVTVASTEELIKELTQYMISFVRLQGMLVMRNPDNKKDVTRRLIPMHMLSNIDSDVVLITGDLSELTLDGKTVNSKTGEPVLVQ